MRQACCRDCAPSRRDRPPLVRDCSPPASSTRTRDTSDQSCRSASRSPTGSPGSASGPMSASGGRRYVRNVENDIALDILIEVCIHIAVVTSIRHADVKFRHDY